MLMLHNVVPYNYDYLSILGLFLSQAWITAPLLMLGYEVYLIYNWTMGLGANILPVFSDTETG